MITYSADRNYARVKEWNDITEMVGFSLTLNPQDHTLASVIAKYEMPEKIRCGLSNCRTPHFKGYVVSTKSGNVTNIGNHCGKKHFGLEFQSIAKTYEQGLREYEARESIREFKGKLLAQKERIAKLRSGENGVDVTYNRIKSLVTYNKGIPNEIINELKKMIRNRNSKISVSRKLNETEIKDLEAIQRKRLPRPYYIDEKIGELAGLAALYKENDLREIVVHDIECGFKKLEELDEEKEKYKKLIEVANWCSAFEAKLAKVESIRKLSLPLLTLDNLYLLKTLIDKNEDIKIFEETVKKIV